MILKRVLTYGCMLFWMALTSGQTVHTAYDFTGNAVKTREAHGFGGETHTLLTENAYDGRGRLLWSVARLDGGAPVRAEYGYDVAGRLVTVTRGSLADSLSYNVRGWLAGKRSGAFAMALHYADSVAAGVEPSWNGNISAWEWGHGAASDRLLAFSYDGADRLTGSTAFVRGSAGWTESPTGDAERGITYDGNGNMLTLRRTAGGAVVDDLEYGYEGNRLVSVEDKAQPGRKGDVFRVGNSSYAYDANGNMVEDTGRELTFGYNVLDLLETAVAGEGDTLAVYGWSADGARLWTRDGSGDGLDYLGSLTLSTEDGETRLETAAIGGGVIRVGKDGRQTAEYHVTDHLGSVRVVVDGAGDALERNDYYPFGARYGEEGWPESGNRFKFNGKEEQVTGNLGFLDYGARMYDPAVGRWWSVDPAAGERLAFSGYAYCSSNPVNRTDPDGSLDDKWLLDITTGNMIWHGGLGGDEHQLVYPVAPGGSGSWLSAGDGVVLPGSLGRYYFTGFKGGVVASTVDYGAFMREGLVGYKGYEYDLADLRMRLRILNGPSHHMRTYLLSLEAKGWAEPLTSYNYWKTYGSTLGSLLVMDSYVSMAAGLSGGAQGGKVPGYRTRNVFGQVNIRKIPSYESLLEMAQRMYPKKAGKMELHHIIPQYMGGARNGRTVRLDAAYHQLITNEFRRYHLYGKGILTEAERLDIARKVYTKYPLPKF